ncbi:MAG: DUF5317 domain-containing protein [Clostridia bacterium]|nr:DUF5317 domain-containing protein [Clostridia bacterium]
MLYVLMILSGILLGLLTGGKLSNLVEFKLEKAWIVMLAFILLVTVRIAGMKFYVLNEYAMIANGLVAIILFIGLWYNRYYAGIWLIGAGSFMNALIILLNDGKMPVGVKVALKAGVVPEIVKSDIRHFVFYKSSEVKLSFLADVVYLPGFIGYGMPIVSIGDLIIAAGLAVLMMQIVRNKRVGNPTVQ